MAFALLLYQSVNNTDHLYYQLRLCAIENVNRSHRSIGYSRSMDTMYHPLNLTLDLYLKRMAENGEFDHLEGEGKPIDLSPEAPTVLDKLMMEADVKPVVVLLNQKQIEIRSRLATVHDPVKRKSVLRELADIQTRIAIEIEAHKRFG